MSSTMSTCRPVRSMSRSLTMRTTPLVRVADPYDDTAMKSNSTGRSIARARSLMNMNAPLSTPTSSGGRSGVVGGDLLAELGDALLQVVGRRPRPRRDADRSRPDLHRAVRSVTVSNRSTRITPRGPRLAADRPARPRRPRRGRRRAPTRPRRTTAAARPASTGRPAGRAAAAAPPSDAAPGSPAVGHAVPGELVEELGLVPQHVGLAGEHRHEVARARRDRASAGARGAPRPAGTRTSSFVGSCDRRRCRAAGRSRAVSARRSPRSGRTIGPRRTAMPASPAAPLPRRRLSSTVSAWSSSGVPDEDRGRAAARRRAASSAPYRGVARPRLEVRRRAATSTARRAEPGAETARRPRRPCRPRRRCPARSPWSTCTATGSSPASTASASSASESAPPEQPTTTGPARSSSTRSRRRHGRATGGVVTARRSGPVPPGAARPGAGARGARRCSSGPSRRQIRRRLAYTLLRLMPSCCATAVTGVRVASASRSWRCFGRELADALAGGAHPRRRRRASSASARAG